MLGYFLINKKNTNKINDLKVKIILKSKNHFST